MKKTNLYIPNKKINEITENNAKFFPISKKIFLGNQMKRNQMMTDLID